MQWDRGSVILRIAVKDKGGMGMKRWQAVLLLLGWLLLGIVVTAVNSLGASHPPHNVERGMIP
ncbi:MAG TPA: hypothetical protein ENM97_05635 [Moorella mulderi]|nr:hypothetical protein [Moorella mulderi]